MTAIYRKEMKNYGLTMHGYIFAAFLLAAIGLYFSFTNLNLASPKFEAVLGNVQFVFLVFVPILTMRVMADERRQGTDQLLFTLPLKTWEIVTGKYLALVTIFAIPMAVICTYPVILSRYGEVNSRAAYGSILGFFLLGCAYLGIGLLCSCLTDSPVIAAVLCFLVLLLTYLMKTICRMVPETAAASLAAGIMLLVLFSALMYGLMRIWSVPLLVCAGGTAALSVLFRMDRTAFEGRLPSFLQLFYLNGRFEGFTEGILDLRAVVYYLSIAVFTIFLSSHVLDRHDLKEKNRFADGIYRLVSVLLCMAALALIHLIGARLPSSVMEPDFTTSGIHSLTKETEDLLSGLREEIRLYLICEKGKEDETILRLLEKYQETSSFIRSEQVDPALNPGFVSRYTDKKADDNSVIAVYGGQSRLLSAQDMYTIGTSAVTGRRIETGFAGESLITAAIDSLVHAGTAVFYLPDANQESLPGDTFMKTAESAGIEIRPLNLLAAEAVPEDAAGIILNAPATDYAQESVDKVLTYLENGGNALILSNYSLQPMPGLDAIIGDYGMKRLEGIVLEGDPSRYISYQYCLIPSVSYTQVTADVYNRGYLLMPMAQGIQERDTYRSSVRLTPLLSTSQASYNKADVQNMTTAEREEGDETGPFLTGMLAEEDIDQDGAADTRVVYYSSGYLLDEDYDRSVSGTNAVLFGATLRYLSGNRSSRLTIPVKSMQEPVLALTDFSANFWTVICVFVLPGLITFTGIVNWLVRRKRKA